MARFAVEVPLSLAARGLSLIVLLTNLALAQDPGPGVPMFSSDAPGGFDLATTHIHINIPIRNKIRYDSSVFFDSYYYTSGGYWALRSATTQSLNFGDPTTPTVTFSQSILKCTSGGTYNYNYGLFVVDRTGASHPIPATWKSGCTTTSVSPTVASDGSGWTVSINGSTNAGTLWDKAGHSIPLGCGSPPCGTYEEEDADGNTISWSGDQPNYGSGSVTDSFGVTALGGTINSTYGGLGTLYYKDVNGNQQTYTFNYTTKNVTSSFGCTGIIEYSGGMNFLTSITTPTGASYTFTYTSDGRIASITFPSGGSISYSYSGMNCTSHVVETTTITVKDNNGNIGVYTYTNSNSGAPVSGSAQGNYTVVRTDPAGNQTTFSFNGEYQTDAKFYQGTSTLLKEVTTCYNGNLSGCVQPSTAVTLPITETDTYTSFNGGSSNRSQTVYDCNTSSPCYGLVVSTANYDFGASTLLSQSSIAYGTWNGSSCASIGNYIYDKPCDTKALDGSGNTKAETRITYSATGHPTSTSRWVSGSTWLTSTANYNSNGTVNWMKDAGGNQTTISYDGSCNSLVPTKTTYPLSSVGYDSQTWDCNGGVITSKTEVNGNTTQYTYADPLWRITQISYPDSSSDTETFSYYTGSNYPWYVYFTRAATSSTSLTGYQYFDGLGRPTTRELDGYGWQNTIYNNLGQVYQVSNPYVCNGTNCSPADPTYGLTTYTYDALGRATEVVYPDGSLFTETYTNRATTVCGNPCNGSSGVYGLDRVYQTDGLGRLVSVCDGIGAATQANQDTTKPCGQDAAANGFLATYGYDALGNLTSVSYGGTTYTQTRNYSYDALSRLVSETNPESGMTTYSYDSSMAGDLYQGTDARGRIATYSYDALHRVTGITFSDSTPNIWYTYDGGVVPWGNTLYNTKGQLVAAGTPSQAIAMSTFSYDQMGRITDVYSCNPILCSQGSYSNVGYTYDFRGDRTGLFNHSVGITLSYSYDTLGDLTGITSNYSNSTNPPTIISNFQYNALHLPTSDSRADGNTEAYSYDPMGRLLSYSVTGSNPYSLSLGYNTAGDVTSATDSIDGTWSYNYYGVMLHKLAWAGCTANCPGGWANFTYAYDEFGNRWQQNPSGNGSGFQYTFTASNQVSTSDGVSYNAAGGMIADGLGDSYGYDALSRLSWISGSNTATYTYDAFGNRVEEAPEYGAGVTTDFTFDPEGRSLHRTTSGNSAFGMEVYGGGRHLGLYTNGNFYYFYQNQVGTLRMRTNYSSSGSTLGGTCAELPFGDARTCSGTFDQVEFAGYRIDVDGEYFAPARAYTPTQGRWTVPDPAGLAAVNPTNPQTWNRYAYSLNNPVSLRDPSGLYTGVDDTEPDGTDSVIYYNFADGSDDVEPDGGENGSVPPPPDVSNLPVSTQQPPDISPPIVLGPNDPVSVQPVFYLSAMDGTGINVELPNGQAAIFQGNLYQMDFVTSDGSDAIGNFTVQQNVQPDFSYNVNPDVLANSVFSQYSTDGIGYFGPFPQFGINIQTVTYTATTPEGIYPLTTVINQVVVVSGGSVTSAFPVVVQKRARRIRRAASRAWSVRSPSRAVPRFRHRW